MKMRLFITTCLILLFSTAYALPFQAPVAGNYQCFSSEKSAFDENAQDIGATLAFNADSSYTFTTSSASENGSVTVSEDTSADLNNFFQSGSSLVLQPSSGSTSYEAMFVTDKQGGMYVFLENNNGLKIRCESPGTDIANAIKQIATEQVQTTQPANTPETSSSSTSEPLAPGQAIESGIYSCSYTLDVVDFAYPELNDRYIDTVFALFVYDDRTTLTLEQIDDHYSYLANPNGSYTFDAATNSIRFKDVMNLAELTMYYENNAEGQTAFSYSEIWPGNSDDEWTATHSCAYDEALRSPETYGLDPAKILTPLQAIEPGIYNCSYTYDSILFASSEDPGYYPDEDPDIFRLFIYDDGTTLTLEDADRHVSEFAPGSYQFDAAKNSVFFKGGFLGGKTLSYGKNAEGKTALFYSRSWREDPEGTDDDYTVTYTCEYSKAIEQFADLELAATTPSVDLMNITIAPIKTDPSVNPNEYPIPDVYYCYSLPDDLDYDEAGFPQLVREAQLEILPNFIYRLDGEEGQFKFHDKASGNIKWLSGPLNPEADVTTIGEYESLEPYTSRFYFGEWGEEISSVDIPAYVDNWTLNTHCYQQGAREQLELLNAALKRPQEGSYNCIDNEGKQSVLEFLPDNRYRLEGEEGNYHYAMHAYGTDITWENGPLGLEAEYSGDDSTGLRELTFTSRTTVMGGGLPAGSYSELVQTCQMFAKNNLIPTYGTQAAPPAPAGSGGLDGFYAMREYDSDHNAVWTVYHFLPDGYVYEGGYHTDNQCTRTYPNGLPVCKSYSLQGNTVTFSSGDGITFEPADQGAMIDGEFYEEKRLTGPRTLNGTFESLSASADPIISMGTNSFSERSYTFSEDGSFTFFSSYSSSTAAPNWNVPGGIGGLMQSSGSDSDQGTYSIDGNVITFNYAAGYSEKCTFFYPVNGDLSSVHICGTDYDPPYED
jgi:hypothetical protein